MAILDSGLRGRVLNKEGMFLWLVITDFV